jgi:predicted DNA-binding transcriptional regulator YafY
VLEIAKQKVTEGNKRVLGNRISRAESLNYDETMSFINSTGAIELFKTKLGSSAEIGNYISAGRGESSGGALWLDVVAKAMTERRTLRFLYQKYNDPTSSERVVEPYFLKSHNHIWYLLAREISSGAMKTFGVDRVTELIITEDHFKRRVDFNPGNYFDQQIGVFVDPSMNPETVTIEINNPYANRIVKSPLHDSQKIIADTPEMTTISLFICLNSEFFTEILKMGKHARIISPKTAQEKMVKMIDAILNNYKNQG